MNLSFVAVLIGAVAVLILWRPRRPRSRQASGLSDAELAASAGPVARRLVQGIVAVLTYVLGPVRLLRTHEVKRPPPVTPLTPAEFDALPVETQRWMTHGEATLERQGFARAARLSTEPTTSVRSYVSLLEHGFHTTLASVVVTRGEQGRTGQAILFRSELADGTVVATTSHRLRSRFPRRPRFDGMVFPDVVDPKALLALHRFRVEERAAGIPLRKITTAPNPIAYQAREMSETYDYWVGIGYYREGSNGNLRLTPKGAACMVWRAKFPWAQLTDWRDGRARNAVLARYAAAHPGF